MISQTTRLISKIQTPFDSPERELFKHGVKLDLEVTDDVTGRVKVRMFDFSVLVTLASTILMLGANKANESAWVVLLICVGEDGVNWPFFYKTIYLKIEDIFLHHLNAGRCDLHFTFLGCKIKMMG